MIDVPQVVLDFIAGDDQLRVGPVDDVIAQGERHRRLLSISGSMRRRGLTAAEIEAALLVVNANRCRPPLADSEVARLAEDVAHRYQPEPRDTEQERIEVEAERVLNDPGADSQPKQRRPAVPLIVPLDEFLSGSGDEAAWIVDHIAARGALSLLAGIPKVGKSTFLYGLLGAVSSGTRFLGLDVAASGVLLLTEEPAQTVEEKADRFGLDDERVWVLSKRRIRSGRKWARIIADAAAFCGEHAEVRVVVVDTIDKFADLDAKRSEADTGVIREMIDPLYELLDLGCAVLLVTHQRKQEGEHGLRVRGGTSLTGSADIIVEIERPAPSAGLSRQARLVKFTSRFEGSPDELAVLLNHDGGWQPIGNLAAVKRQARREQILALLDATAATLDEIHARGDGASKRTLRRRLAELVIDGLAERCGEGVKADPWRWRLTEAGALFVPDPVGTNPAAEA